MNYKLSIARKEAAETKYWIKLLSEVEIIERNHASSLLDNIEEILKILTSILKSSKKNNYE